MLLLSSNVPAHSRQFSKILSYSTTISAFDLLVFQANDPSINNQRLAARPKGSKFNFMNLNSLPPEDWFTQFKKGDKKAFAQMVRLYEPGLILFADSLQPNELRSEKIVSRSFQKAFARRKIFTSKDDLLIFLRKLIKKACTPPRYFRRTRKIITRKEEEFPEFCQNDSCAETPFTCLIEKGIWFFGPMPPKTRLIFELFYRDLRSESEIAAELGLTKQDVMKKMRRFLKIPPQYPGANLFSQ